MAAKPKPVPRTGQEHAHFATRLRQWRTGRGLMLKQVADEFGVAEATWSRWEKQERFPSPGNLRLLAEFIGVPICCFFYPAPGSCPNCPGNHQANPEPADLPICQIAKLASRSAKRT
jgi:transcriptional regulator with XRE-family HTH domain